jgi:hypothetical protein
VTDKDAPGKQLQPPAPRPCTTCPYRKDVPSGIWEASEYEKLARYDAPTGKQPAGLFECHLIDPRTQRQRICAGWAGCHDGDHLLALRFAVRVGKISPETHRAAIEYRSPVPLFASGAEAAAHGLRDLHNPSADADRAITKILRVRSDIIVPGRRDTSAPERASEPPPTEEPPPPGRRRS